MDRFTEAFGYVIKQEGYKFVADKSDRGGATKYGISSRFLKSLKDDDLLPMIDGDTRKKSILNISDYIKNMDLNQAKLIYHYYIWAPIYDGINNQDVCNYVFDMTVNHGFKKSSEIAQIACNAEAKDSSAKIKVDGIFGADTLNAINKSDPNDLMRQMTSIREHLYRCIAANDESQKKYLIGWINRCRRAS